MHSWIMPQEGNIFLDIFETMVNIYSEYFNKIQNHCYVESALGGYGGHFIQRCLNIFEQLGFVSTFGVIMLWMAAVRQDSDIAQKSVIILEANKALIKNNLATLTPCYDNIIIEISIAIYLFANCGEKDFIDHWIWDIVNHIAFSYKNMGQYFPIQSDYYDDLVALNVSKTMKKEKMKEMSTLLPILAQWCVVLDLKRTYEFIKKTVSQVFNKCTLQIWYPDEQTENYIYRGNASINSGIVDAPMTLFDSIEEMKKMIREVNKIIIKPELISSINKKFPILLIIASRHFRTPILPYFWQRLSENDATP